MNGQSAQTLKVVKKIVKKNTGYIYIWHDLTHLLVKPLTEGAFLCCALVTGMIK